MTFLLVLAILYFGMRLLIRVALPAYLNRKVQQMQDVMDEKRAQYEEPTPEGEVKIVRKQQQGQVKEERTERTENDDYIDYEDLSD